MKTVLFYFSATGNSLTTAQKIAAALGDCQLIPVAALKHKSKIIVDAQRVGFIFPVYYGNMPWPVREAVSKMVFPKDIYSFIFTTCRGHAGKAANRMDLLLRTRGIALSLSRGIGLPGNSYISTPENTKKQLDEQDANIAAQLKDIQDAVVENYLENEIIPQTPIDYPNNFRGIIADENCIGCGTCVQICPMENIRLDNGRAVIGDDCTTCLACFHWCPKEAIWMSKQEDIARREKYYHPDISLMDIIKEKESV